MKYYIYRHIRLDTNEVFYVGKGCGYRYKVSNKRNEYWHNITNISEWHTEIILDNLSEHQAYEKEIEFIKLYKSQGMCKANFKPGGKGGNGLLGKKRPGHSKTVKRLWKEGKFKNVGSNIVNRQKVYCITNDKFYPSINQAARELGLLRQSISKVCRGVIKSTGGYRFKYGL